MSGSDKFSHLDVKGGRIAYEAAGQGSGIVLIHAAIADRRMWNREFKRLAGDHRVVRYDFRGYGGSSKTSEPFSAVHDLGELIDHVGLRRPVLVGSSMGGGLAIDFALARPHDVSGLFLIAPGVSGMQLSMFPEDQEAFAEDDRASAAVQAAWREGRKDEAMEGLRRLWVSALKGPSLELFRTMLKDNMEEVFTEATASQAQREGPGTAGRLAEVHVPTVVIYGDRDNPSSGPIARFVAKGIPGALLVQIPGGDHLTNLSQPDAFDAALADFLRRIQ